jgi:hypothetical protein
VLQLREFGRLDEMKGWRHVLKEEVEAGVLRELMRQLRPTEADSREDNMTWIAEGQRKLENLAQYIVKGGLTRALAPTEGS